MKKWEKYKIPLIVAGIAVLILLSAVLVGVNLANSNQSKPSMFFRVTFQGEYAVGDGEFQPLERGEKIPANRGEVTLRGYFQLETQSGEVVDRVGEGTPIALYFNHIGGEITVSGQETHIFDSENRKISESTCGESWTRYVYTGTESDTVTIVLRNPHDYGNATAFDEFLGSMYVYAGSNFENQMVGAGMPERIMAFLFIVVGLVLIGIALYLFLLRIKQNAVIWFAALITLFAGGCFLLGSKNFSLWSSVVILNTTVLGLCVMLYDFFFFCLTAFFLSEKVRRFGVAAVAASGAALAVLIAVSLAGGVFLYDCMYIWKIIRSFFSVFLFVLLCCSIKGEVKTKLLIRIPCGMGLIAFLVDFAGVGLGWWKGGVACGLAFFVLFLLGLVYVLRIMSYNIRASMREKELLAERKALQAELQESRVSIMLSQIQPHFLYNVLNSIYYLCGKDIQTARSAISSFSDYLRNNLDSLDQKELIPFETEMQHIRTYLDLEQIRFGEELTVEYDLGACDFKLPILSVQPLVENAVKHGISKKRGGGKVTLSTRRDEGGFVVTVSDTGVGFDPAHYAEDGKKHVGIENVRQRLERMCGGTLTVESEPGKGTIVTVRIPAKEAGKQ